MTKRKIISTTDVDKFNKELDTAMQEGYVCEGELRTTPTQWTVAWAETSKVRTIIYGVQYTQMMKKENN